MINLTTAVWDAQRNANRVMGSYPSAIQMCRIDKVDTKRKLVKIYVFDSKMYREDVPYMFPYMDGTNGIMFAPKPGAFGVMVMDSTGVPFIIGFTMPVMSSDTGPTRDMPHMGAFNTEDISGGEIIITSSGGARIKLDESGGIRISSSTLDCINVLPNGHIEIEAAKDINVSVGVQQFIISNDRIVLKGNIEIQGTFKHTAEGDD